MRLPVLELEFFFIWHLVWKCCECIVGYLCLGMDWSINRIMMLDYQNLPIVIITILIVHVYKLSKPTSSECLQFDRGLNSVFSLSFPLFVPSCIRKEHTIDLHQSDNEKAIILKPMNNYDF